MNKNYIFSLLVSALPLLADAQWSTSSAVNTPICVATDKQVDLRMIKDGKGGAYITWKDYRASGVPDIYIQRINANGVPKWTLDGVPLCTNSADQSTPAIVSDGQGGAIVTWSDWRSNIERDIYAQRIDSNGLIKWAADGILVTGKTAREHNPKITTDEAGGAIISWEQQSGGIWDIWAQRISSTGAPMWAVGGIPLCSVAANRINPKIQEDGKGGAIVVWQDERSGTYDIYGQRVTGAGALKWGTSAKLICGAADVQTDPKIDPDTTIGGAYVVWIDSRSGTSSDLYAQRVDSLGTAKWAANGIAVVNVAGNQTAQDLLSNGSTGGLIVVWKDKRSGTEYDIYGQKLSAAGAPLWGASGSVICNNPKNQLNPNIIQDDAGGAIVVWQDSTGGTYDIKAQRLNGSGTRLWPVAGVDVGTATGNQIQPKNVSDDHGGSIFAFQDKRSVAYDIYAHHLYKNGTVINGISDKYLAERITCSPNPFTNQLKLMIPLSASEIISITGTDITGKEVAALKGQAITQEDTRCTVSINTESHELAPGMYLLKVITTKGSGTVQVMKKDQ